MQRTPSSTTRFDEPEAGDDRLGQAARLPDDDGDDDGYIELGVAHRINPLPLREEEEEELSDADLLDAVEDDVDVDDAKLEGSDA